MKSMGVDACRKGCFAVSIDPGSAWGVDIFDSVCDLMIFYLIDWNTGMYLKYLVLGVASFAPICLLYDVSVGRINILQFLSGLYRLS